MENRVLRYFLTVVSEGNISAAAKLLHVTQPTLSRQLKDLENELNVDLFYRRGRYIELTQEGYYLANQAKNIINLIDRTTSHLINDEIAGEVSIGLAESKAIKPIITAMKKVRVEEKQVIFDTFSGNAEQIFEQLDNGIIDFGVVVEPINKVNYASLRLSEQDKWGILTRVDSELSGYNKITSEMLINQPLIVSKQRGVQKMISNLLDIDESYLNIIAKYNLLYNASLMVKEGMGHAICIDGVINTSNTDLRFIPIDNEITSDLSIIWKSEKQLSLSAQLFLKKLKEGLNDDV